MLRLEVRGTVAGPLCWGERLLLSRRGVTLRMKDLLVWIHWSNSNDLTTAARIFKGLIFSKMSHFYLFQPPRGLDLA